ncbi:MAG: DUF1743 domain-containing protein [Halodesulfurarchaeum sp.]
MTVIGLDDTDSRDRGMCTTYAAVRVARAIRDRGGTVETLRLVRLNPAVEHKTRGNAALAVQTSLPPEPATEVAAGVIEDLAETADPRTQPGLVVAAGDIPEAVVKFSRRAVTTILDRQETEELLGHAGFRHRGWLGGRGLIGALAAVGAVEAFEDWTYEYIAYRQPERWGTPREVEEASVFAAADAAYPAAWDTVDRGEGEAVCVPNAPGPILFGIRGDDPGAVARVAAGIDSEPIHDRALFVTNQGTDAHLQDAPLAAVSEASAFRVTGTVASAPETKEGGHVFLTLRDGETTLRCAAFEPTKRFRDRVRALRAGDVITAAGEVTDGTLKLEKFAVRELVREAAVTPTCPDCGRTMESAGSGQGYRCRRCETTAAGKETRELDRELERGWYEVPPCARRHIAKPLVRGGFDGPVHPER